MLEAQGAIRLSSAGTPDQGARWFRPLLRILSPEGSRGRLTILIFHRVHERPDTLFPNEIHADVFRERMRWIRSSFNVLPLDDAVTALAQGNIPARALAITFDDGYADNFTVALPILRELGLSATFFIATGFLDGGRMWNDTVIEAIRDAKGNELDLTMVGLGVFRGDSPEGRRNAIEAILGRLKYLPPRERLERADSIAAIARVEPPSNLMMSGEQIRELARAGMGIGGHTVSHPILARLDEASARQEISDGRDALEALTRQPVNFFAYPNGKPLRDYTAAHVRMVKSLGFRAAVSTAHGAARVGDTPYELPRFTPWGRTSARWGWWLARNFSSPTERAPA